MVCSLLQRNIYEIQLVGPLTQRNLYQFQLVWPLPKCYLFIMFSWFLSAPTGYVYLCQRPLQECYVCKIQLVFLLLQVNTYQVQLVCLLLKLNVHEVREVHPVLHYNAVFVMFRLFVCSIHCNVYGSGQGHLLLRHLCPGLEGLHRGLCPGGSVTVSVRHSCKSHLYIAYYNISFENYLQ